MEIIGKINLNYLTRKFNTDIIPFIDEVQTQMDVMVKAEHPELGIGEILEISFDTGDPLVSVQWDDGRRGCYWTEELEFLAMQL